jgi:hypothetical protein
MAIPKQTPSSHPSLKMGWEKSKILTNLIFSHLLRRYWGSIGGWCAGFCRSDDGFLAPWSGPHFPRRWTGMCPFESASSRLHSARSCLASRSIGERASGLQAGWAKVWRGFVDSQEAHHLPTNRTATFPSKPSLVLTRVH